MYLSEINNDSVCACYPIYLKARDIAKKDFPFFERFLLDYPRLKYKYTSDNFLSTFQEELKKEEIRPKLVSHHKDIIRLEDVVGTYGNHKKYCFSKNYMPVVSFSENLDFISRWEKLAKNPLCWVESSNLINLVGYKDNFYVIDGNRRVSVAKYFGLSTLKANVVYYSDEH